ncbi:PREDICTED: uncharacterized protein LOC109116555 [Tarenaya hassleriana]|uniref:uncharacterized protein LOC109116555 n=1 Tax=Tarenaya hassleriana TaxID=28532 RepID=UPI0008FD52CD|nr:PREDICTED: uncharacterized protein LOC109116555 [Tarenaya hassleriana]
MTDTKPVSTPMASTSRLTAISGSLFENATKYRALVGSLQYLSLTRPDISLTNFLNLYMLRPIDHWQAVKRVLRYLVGTRDCDIFLSVKNCPTLHAFSDADWAGDRLGFKSTRAHVVFLGRHPVSWSSKKQRGIARSSTEAEYRSVATTTAEVRWIASLLLELSCPLSSTPIIYCDNIGATYLSANPVFHSRMKHIAL